MWKKEVKNKIIFFSKWIILIFVIFSILFKIVDFNFANAYRFDHIFNEKHNYFFLFLSLLGLVLNISLEALKWRTLISTLESIKFVHSLKAILVAMSAGLITPARLGEIPARVVFLQHENRISGLSPTISGSFAQFFVTVFIGLLSLANLIFQKALIQNDWKWLFIITSILFFISSLALIFMSRNLGKCLNIKLYSHWKRIADAFQNIPLKTNIISFLLSFLRLCVYNAQFYFLLLFWGCEISIIDSFTATFSIFLFLSVIPSFILADLGIRGIVSLFFLGLFTQNQLAIIFATFSLWALNIAIPTLIGSIFLFQIKLGQKTHNL